MDYIMSYFKCLESQHAIPLTMTGLMPKHVIICPVLPVGMSVKTPCELWFNQTVIIQLQEHILELQFSYGNVAYRN